MRNDRLTQESPPTIEDFFELVSALRRDLQRHHELQLTELAAIKTGLKELEKGLGRAESQAITAPQSDKNGLSIAESGADTKMQVPEKLPTLLHVETPPVNDPMKGVREKPLENCTQST